MFISDCEVLVCTGRFGELLVAREACRHKFVVRLFEDSIQRVGVGFSVNPLCALTTMEKSSLAFYSLFIS